MRIRPAPGLTVRHPITREFIPEEGIEFPETDTAIARLIQSGDVVPDKTPAKPQKGA